MANFNPNEAGQKNGKIFGFPYSLDEAELVIIPVPWDVTTSYGKGTAKGPKAILDASPQLDFYHPFLKNAWEKKIVMLDIPESIFIKSQELAPKVDEYIEFLETGGDVDQHEGFLNLLHEVTEEQKKLSDWIKQQFFKFREQGKKVALLGGDHSTPLGLIQAINQTYQGKEWGILQIDAHADLRKAYEGFEQSHASISYNILDTTSVAKLVQVGIRDICQEEVDFISENQDRISVYYDRDIKEGFFKGINWDKFCEEIIESLPERVYITFDIDGLKPEYCPNTGTPVPGGLEFEQAVYLIEKLALSGKEIIGFDLNEVSPGDNDWDANVGARILWHLCVASFL